MNKNIFTQELEKLNLNKELKEEIIHFYNNKDNKNNNNLKKSKEILKKIFNPEDLMKDTMIPISFITENAVGRVLIAALINQGVLETYTVSDLIDKTGYSRQYIHQEISCKNLIAYKEGRNYKITKERGDLWLEKKGFKG